LLFVLAKHHAEDVAAVSKSLIIIFLKYTRLSHKLSGFINYPMLVISPDGLDGGVSSQMK
jgi:hypothetical protein